jgi:hypothetical protein
VQGSDAVSEAVGDVELICIKYPFLPVQLADSAKTQGERHRRDAKEAKGMRAGAQKEGFRQAASWGKPSTDLALVR